MKSWEETKLRFDPSEHQDVSALPVRINLAALVGDNALGGKALADCVEEYNRIHRGQLICKRGTTILMPLLQMQDLFKNVIEKIVRSRFPHQIHLHCLSRALTLSTHFNLHTCFSACNTCCIVRWIFALLSDD